MNEATELELPRDDLIRLAAPLELRVEADDNTNRTMVGHPIVFDQWTEIDSWEGNFMERIAPGATRRTVRAKGNKIKVLWNHGFDPSIGNKPLGVPDVMREDETGLYVEVPLARTSYNDDLIALMTPDSSGRAAVDGMSFRFRVTREKIDRKPKVSDYNPQALPERTIQEIELFEFGPVTFPAYQAASVGLRANWHELSAEERARIAQIIGIVPHEPNPGTSATLGERDNATPVTPANATSRLTPAQLRAALIVRGVEVA